MDKSTYEYSKNAFRYCYNDILKSIMITGKNNVQLFINSLSYLKKVINKNTKHSVVIPKNKDIDLNLLCLILGPSPHTKYTEPF